MWAMILLLWLIPVGLAVVALSRIVDGLPAVKAKEQSVLFDQSRKTEIGPWLLLMFAAIAVMFFAVGLVQGIVVPNLGLFWIITVPLLTGGAAVLIVAAWLRQARPGSRKFRGTLYRIQTRATRIARNFISPGRHGDRSSSQAEVRKPHALLTQNHHHVENSPCPP